MRVVSLIASSTEIVCRLGREADLVARSHECDFPPHIKQLPQVTETKFSPDGTSYQIDQRLKAILQEGLSVYRVLAEPLRELRPDVILTQTQCEVCAVSERDVLAAVSDLVGAGTQVVTLKTDQLKDLWRDIAKVAQALDAAREGEALILSLQNRLSKLSRRANEARAAAGREKPKVACIEWIEPLMSSGNWIPELVEIAGGVSLFGEVGKHSPYLSMDALAASDPDFILVLPCGFDLDRTREEFAHLSNSAAFTSLRAYREGKVYLLDGNAYFNRPGPRLVESAEIIAEILQPDVFKFGHGGMERVLPPKGSTS